MWPPGLRGLYPDVSRSPDRWSSRTVWGVWGGPGWRREASQTGQHAEQSRTVVLYLRMARVHVGTTSLRGARRPRRAPSSWGVGQNSSQRRRSDRCTMPSWSYAEPSRLEVFFFKMDDCIFLHFHSRESKNVLWRRKKNFKAVTIEWKTTGWIGVLTYTLMVILQQEAPTKNWIRVNITHKVIQITTA